MDFKEVLSALQVAYFWEGGPILDLSDAEIIKVDPTFLEFSPPMPLIAGLVTPKVELSLGRNKSYSINSTEWLLNNDGDIYRLALKGSAEEMKELKKGLELHLVG